MAERLAGLTRLRLAWCLSGIGVGVTSRLLIPHGYGSFVIIAIYIWGICVGEFRIAP